MERDKPCHDEVNESAAKPTSDRPSESLADTPQRAPERDITESITLGNLHRLARLVEMQQFDVTSFSIVLASISVIIGVILAILQLREQNKTRQAQLFIEIYAQFMQGELQDMHFEILEAFGQHTQDSHPEIWETNRGRINSVLSFLEGVGVLVKRGLLDINLVADLISTPTIRTWEAIQKWVAWYRNNLNRPQLWEWTEYLYHEIIKIPSRVSPSRPAGQE